MPAQRGVERHPQRATIAAPRPGARVVRLRRERAVVARERHEQQVALRLPRERMDGYERVGRLEVRARGEDHDVGRALRGATSDQRREHGDR